MLRQVIIWAQNGRFWAGAGALAAAMLPVVALASGEAGAMDPTTAAGGGAALAVAVGALAYAVKALAGRGSNGPPNPLTTQPGGASGHGERIAVLEARMQHKDERDREHAHLLDELRKALSEQARAVDRAVAGNNEIIAAIRALGENPGNSGGGEG